MIYINNNEKFFNEYKKINNEATTFDAWQFGSEPDVLLDLVLKGEKKATASAYKCYEHYDEEMPKENGYSIILNSNDEPKCIIKITKVYTVPYNEVTKEHAFLEGEGDKSLEFWRKVHKDFFEKEYEDMGLTFDENILVVCEEFEVVYKK